MGLNGPVPCWVYLQLSISLVCPRRGGIGLLSFLEAKSVPWTSKSSLFDSQIPIIFLALKTAKKAKKPSRPKTKKKLVKKKIAKKSSPAKKVKKISKKSLSKAASKKKAVSSNKAEVSKSIKRSQALPKLGPETLKIKERLMGKRSELLKLIQSSKSLERDAWASS